MHFDVERVDHERGPDVLCVRLPVTPRSERNRCEHRGCTADGGVETPTAVRNVRPDCLAVGPVRGQRNTDWIDREREE